jgi:glycosyltransferase involved in cell wall biosynthesis
VNSGSRETGPLVSVLLPTHNRPQWLSTALTSVLQGEFEDLEVIVSNNGRVEDTRHLAEEIDDARVRWIEQPPCGGLEHFLKALPLASGRYVAVLHDDDWWHPRLLATLIPELEDHPETIIAFADYWRVNAEGTIDLAATEYESRQSGRATLAPGIHQPFYDLAVRESVAAVIGSAFRRDALSPSDIPPEVGLAYDLWTGYLFAATGGAAYVCPDRLVYLRTHATNTFATEPISTLLGAVYCQRRMLRDPRFAPHRKELRRRLAARERDIGVTLLRQGARSAARSHLRKGLRLKMTVKGFGAWGASWILPRSVLARLRRPLLDLRRERNTQD